MLKFASAAIACIGLVTASVAQSYVTSSGTSFQEFEDLGSWSPVNSTLGPDNIHVKSGTAGLKVSPVPGYNGYARKQISQDFSTMSTVSFWVYVDIPTISTSFHGVSLHLSSDGFVSDMHASTSDLHSGWTKVTFAKSDFASEGGATWTKPITWLEIGVFGDTSNGLSVTWDAMRLNETTRPKVILSFDDGYDSTYLHAMPKMDAYGFKGVNFTISGKTGVSGYLSLSQLSGLYNDGWDLCNHTANHPDLSTLTQQQVATELSTCEQFLVSNGFTRNQAYLHVAYPYGRYSDAVFAAEQQLGMLTGRGTRQQAQANTLDSRYMLYTFVVDNTVSRAQVLSAVDGVIARGGVLQINFHRLISGTPSIDIDWNSADFDAVVDYVATKKQAGQLDVATLTQWYQGLTQAMPVGASISLTQGSVVGGSSLSGSVILDSALSQSSTVSLSSNSAAATVPSSVSVAANATVGSFTVSTKQVAASTTATLAATLNGITRTANLTLLPAMTMTLSVPAQVRPGRTVTGTIYLSSPAPALGVINLTSSNPAVTLPSTVRIWAGHTSTSFWITAAPNSRGTSAKITASYNGLTATSSLVVRS